MRCIVHLVNGSKQIVDGVSRIEAVNGSVLLRGKAPLRIKWIEADEAPKRADTIELHEIAMDELERIELSDEEEETS